VTLTHRRQAFLFTLPALVATLGLIGFPLLYTAWLSLHRWFGSQTQAPEWRGLRNFADLLGDDNFLRSLGITVAFTAVTVAAAVVIGLALAIALNRPSGVSPWVLGVLLLPVVSTPVAVSTTWRYVLTYEGLGNAVSRSLGLGTHAWLGQQLVIPTLVFVDVTRWTPLVVLILLAGLSSLPTEPFEAARIDGASTLQVLRYVTLPLLQPFVGVAALLRLIDAIKTFDEVLVISGGGPAGASETLYLYAYKVAFSYLTFGYASAVLIAMFAVILVVSLAVARFRRPTW
jgi:multiple sugar transport system permease protein